MSIELLRWIPSLIGLFLAGANCAIFAIIKFNDIRHIGDDIKEIKNGQLRTDEKLDGLSERVSKIEGRLQ